MRLAKLPLSAMIALSTLFGATVAAGSPSIDTVIVVCGVLLAACGGATLNSLQELDLDSLMLRTRRRPLPAGQVRPAQAGWQALLLIGGGLVVLGQHDEPWPLILTAAAVLLYNGLYTPLKKRTILAVIPGLLSGALPPYIGWIGGGGQFLAFPAMLLIILLVLWQVPHVHLILLANQDDYIGSRYPNLLRRLSEASLQRLFIPWVGALACVMMMFSILPQAMASVFRAAVVGNALLLVALFFRLGSMAETSRYRYLFFVLNLFLLLHMGLVMAGRMVAVMG